MAGLILVNLMIVDSKRVLEVVRCNFLDLLQLESLSVHCILSWIPKSCQDVG